MWIRKNIWWVVGGGLVVVIFLFSVILDVLDPGDGARRSAVSLAEVLPDRSRTTLEQAREGIASTDPLVRGRSLFALLDAGDPSAPGHLRAALADPSTQLRVIAIACTRKATPEAFPADLLAHLLSDPDSAVRLPALAALSDAPPQARVAAALVGWISSSDPRVAQEILRIAKSRHPQETQSAREILRSALRHSLPEIRAEALSIVNAWPTAEGRYFLAEVQALGADPDDATRVLAAAVAAKLAQP